MVNQTKYDFSRESNLKRLLLKDIKIEYEKARQQIALIDDDLETVVAAGDTAGVQCPIQDQTCDNCINFKFGICTVGYTRDGG